jgi:hypothetical protein
MLIKAKIKTAEEITKVKECASFYGVSYSYTASMNPEEPNKICSFKKIEDARYDYQRTDTEYEYKYKKEWLKDIVEEIDWSKVPVDAKCLVSEDGLNWERKYFSHVNANGVPKFYCCGATSWSSGNSTRIWNYYKLAEEK